MVSSHDCGAAGCATQCEGRFLDFFSQASRQCRPTHHHNRSHTMELMSLPIGERLTVDIGRRNLCCAKGLPFAEDLDVNEHVEILDSWAGRIQYRTERHLRNFYDNPATFDNSEPLWRMLALTRMLESEFGVHYNPERIDADPDWADSRDLFIHGLLGPKQTGTCPSIPVLIVAIGRRLNYPLRLVHSPGHVFCRWDGKHHQNSVWRDRFNIELHGNGMVNHPDEHYYSEPVKWNVELHEQERRRGDKRLYLRSLEPGEELAADIAQSGHCFEAIGNFDEAWVMYCQAWLLATHDDRYGQYCKLTHHRKLESILNPWGYTSQKFYAAMLNRLRGSKHQFPWELAGRNLDGESAAVASRGISEEISRPLASAAMAVAARHKLQPETARRMSHRTHQPQAPSPQRQFENTERIVSW